MENTKRRNTYIFWALIVILISILATYVKNIYTLSLKIGITIYLLKVDKIFHPQKAKLNNEARS
ncbi:hypothetical protein [Xylocopilactobacillus apicola]|uniref:Uncharacterized protein n=1 Tax=Xylocopilactobacillus apicola TaxID=2932184 RepID=A0AAU9D393_9LACO|nr:hypothetical protein [Xylocopilactobacillus apicola]BDR59286.1 hypothetical protein XA3_17270 [Xylocopilactobacillus apicola]